jgi:glucarate dehydratase
MLHACAVMPNMCHAADSHYHHYLDDVLQGGKMEYKNGAMDVPTGPGLGVKLDEDKLNEYAEAFKRDADLRTHGMIRGDSKRPDWIPFKPRW